MVSLPTAYGLCKDALAAHSHQWLINGIEEIAHVRDRPTTSYKYKEWQP